MMKWTKVLLIVSVVLFCLVPAFAADISGKVIEGENCGNYLQFVIGLPGFPGFLTGEN